MGGFICAHPRRSWRAVAAVGSILLAAGCAARVPRAAPAAGRSAGTLDAPAPAAASTHEHRHLGRRLRRHERPDRRGQEGRAAERHHAALQLGELRRDHEGVHRQVRDQDHRREPRGLQPGRAERDQAAQGPEPRPRRRRRRQLVRRHGGQPAGDWAPYKVATWNDIPAAAKDAERRLLRRLRRLRGHRLRPVQGEDPADVVQVAAQPGLQEPGRDRRQPDPDRRPRSPPSTPRRSPTAARSPTSPPAWPTSSS